MFSIFNRDKEQDSPDARKASFDSLTNLIAGLATRSDKQFHAQYLQAVQLREQTCGAMLRTSWAAGKMARIPAEDMTRAGWALSSDDLSADDQQVLATATNESGILLSLYDAIVYGRCYGGAFLVIGNGNLMDWSTPLNPDTFHKGDKLTLTLVDRTMVNPDVSSIDYRPGSATFGMPMRYRTNEGVAIIHRSRMLEFIGKKLPWQEYRRNGYWHDSIYQDAEDAIKRYDTVASVINSMLYEASVDTLSIEGLAQQLTTTVGTEHVKTRFSLVAQLKSVINMLVIDGKDKYEKKATTFTGVNDIFNSFKSDLAGAADIPITRFFAQSPAGMNATGESDTRNYYDSIAFKQTLELKPKLVLIYSILCRCLLGRVPAGLDVTFNSLWQDAPDKLATAENNRAQATQKYVDMGALQVATVTKDLIARGVYAGIGEDDEKAAKEADGINRDGTDENSPVHTEPEAEGKDQASQVG